MTRDGAPLGYDRHEICVVASFYRRRDVLLASAGCMFLTALSYFISHGMGFVEAPLARAFMRLSAIGVTTLLALRYQSAVQALRAQAALLDLTHDTGFVRDMDDVITYWNRGAEEQYSWTREEAVGRVTSELLQTHFPEPPEKILADLLRTGRWDGELVHTRRDGIKAVVASRWALKRDERGRPQTISETDNDVTAENHALEALVEAQAQLAHVTRVTTLGEMSASIPHESESAARRYHHKRRSRLALARTRCAATRGGPWCDGADDP
jgi:two-component system sensor kinase FixL